MSSVSVIIPCYGYAHYLRECVESVISQPDVDVKLLVIDDASPDDTPGVAAALAREDSRVAYRRHAVNHGHIATYNEGLAWAEGDYTVLLSADDMLTPGALRRAVRLLDAHPEVGFVYGRALTFESSERLPSPRVPDVGTWRIWNGAEWMLAACKAAHIYIRSPEVVVRTSLQHSLGGYRPELPHTADIELWMRFALHGSIGEIVDADQAYYRIHSQNMHHQQYSKRLVELSQRKAAFDAVFAEYGHLGPRLAQARAWVDRRLAREALGAAEGALDEGNASKELVSSLTQFASDTYSRAALTPEFLGLHLRLLLGPHLFTLIRDARSRIRVAQGSAQRAQGAQRTVDWRPDPSAGLTCLPTSPADDPPPIRPPVE